MRYIDAIEDVDELLTFEDLILILFHEIVDVRKLFVSKGAVSWVI